MPNQSKPSQSYSDPRITKLANIILTHSVQIKKNENLMINILGSDGNPLALELVRIASEKGAICYPIWNDSQFQKTFIENCSSNEQFIKYGKVMTSFMTEMDAYIGIRATQNPFTHSDIDHSQLEMFNKHVSKPVHLEQRVQHTKWCVLRYPNNSMAQQAGVSTEAFTNFYFDVCNINYSKLEDAMTPIKELMEKTDRVRIIGKNTDLSFSIKNIPVVKCCGRRNIPDGEVFTAPVRDSINGYITYNAPSTNKGIVFNDIHFKFTDGKIVECSAAQHTDKLKEIIGTDEGASYIGEFSLGLNPQLTHPMNDTLFDEKISGSIHLTPGNAYKTADNGNRSQVHWDLVHIQTPEFGGGCIYFDDILIRKDGKFTNSAIQNQLDSVFDYTHHT